MSIRLVPMSYHKEKVGRHIKASKIKHHWNFVLDEQEISLVLFESKISGKRTLIVNGDSQVSCKQNKEESVTAWVNNQSVVIFKEFDGNFTLKFQDKFFRIEDFDSKYAEFDNIPTKKNEEENTQHERRDQWLDTEYLPMDEVKKQNKPQALYNTFI